MGAPFSISQFPWDCGPGCLSMGDSWLGADQCGADWPLPPNCPLSGWWVGLVHCSIQANMYAGEGDGASSFPFAVLIVA